MTENAVAINDLILQILPPSVLLGLSLFVSLLYFASFALKKAIPDLVSTFHYLLVTAAYVWIVVYDPSGTPGRAVFRLTLLHLLLNGAARAYVDLPKQQLMNKLKRASE